MLLGSKKIPVQFNRLQRENFYDTLCNTRHQTSSHENTSPMNIVAAFTQLTLLFFTLSYSLPGPAPGHRTATNSQLLDP